MTALKRYLRPLSRVGERSCHVYALLKAYIKLIKKEITKASTLRVVATIPHTNPAVAMPRPRSRVRLISFKDKEDNTIATIPLEKPTIPRNRILPNGKVIKDRIPRIKEGVALLLTFASGGT